MWRQIVNIVIGALVAVGSFIFGFMYLGILGLIALILSGYEIDLKKDWPRWIALLSSIGITLAALFTVDSGLLFAVLGVVLAISSLFAIEEA